MPVFKLTVIDLEATCEWSKDHPSSFYVFSNERGYVVTAKSESEARYVASRGPNGDGVDTWWLEPGQTNCEVVVEGPFAAIVLADTPTG